MDHFAYKNQFGIYEPSSDGSGNIQDRLKEIEKRLGIVRPLPPPSRYAQDMPPLIVELYERMRNSAFKRDE